jgi:hypothetical protein
MLNIFVERVSWYGSQGEPTKQMPGLELLVLIGGVLPSDVALRSMPAWWIRLSRRMLWKQNPPPALLHVPLAGHPARCECNNSWRIGSHAVTTVTVVLVQIAAFLST